MTVTTSFIHSSLWPALQLTTYMYVDVSQYVNISPHIRWDNVIIDMAKHNAAQCNCETRTAISRTVNHKQLLSVNECRKFVIKGQLDSCAITLMIIIIMQKTDVCLHFTDLCNTNLFDLLGLPQLQRRKIKASLWHHYDITMTSLKHHWQYRDTDITDMNNTECWHHWKNSNTDITMRSLTVVIPQHHWQHYDITMTSLILWCHWQ